MPTTTPNSAELAEEIKRLHTEYARTRVPGPELFDAIDQLRDLASGPSAGAEEVGAGPWTVTGPEHPLFRGESPLKAAMEAQRYRRQTDPVEAEKFLAAVESIRKEGEEEDKRLIALHGSLDCPACGGSGHVGDTNLASLSAASSGADVLKADLPGWIAYLREAHDDSLDGNESDARSNILSAVSLMESALLAAPAATPPAEKEVRVPLTPEQQLAEFIAWGNETFNYGFKPQTWDAITHEFTHDPTDMAWIAWRAARAHDIPALSEEQQP